MTNTESITERDSLTRARGALSKMEAIGKDGWCLCVSSSAQTDVEDALRDLIAEAMTSYEERHRTVVDDAMVQRACDEYLAQRAAGPIVVRRVIRATLVAALTADQQEEGR